MALASAAVRTSNLTISQSSAEIRTTAAVKARVLEIGIVGATATAQSLGFGRPAAIGVTPGTTATFQRDDSADPACVTTLVTTWGTSPTNPTTYMRRWNGAATIGVGIIWTFPRGIVIPVSSSVVVQNVTAAIACDVSVAIDE
jgi:plastocyanin